MINTNLTITPTDVKLLKYLHKTKVATTKQIGRDIYHTHLPQSMRKCLKRLRDRKLIEITKGSVVNDRSHIYSLTKKGFNSVKRLYENTLVSERYKSDSIEHDLTLVNIRHDLLNKSIVDSYYTENEIQSYVRFNDDPKLNTYKSFLCDALMFCKKGNGKGAYFAIQYEPIQKSSTRYKEILTNYYTEPLLNFVLYVCIDLVTEKKIKEIETQIAKQSDRKIYFIQLKNLIENSNPIKFINQKNEVIQIN
jgi:hypothetical protein